MPTKSKNQKTLHKIPRSNRYKDLTFFILFSTLTISSIGLFSFIESQNNILYFKNFDIEYIETDYLYKFGIEGSRYITNNMQETFICHVPKFTKNVWVKFNDDSDWIKIPESKSFKLKARRIENCTVYLRCDSIITQFTTIIYQPDLPIIEIECNDLISYSKEKCDIRLSPNNKHFGYSTSKYNWAYKKLKANIELRDSTNGYEIELEESSNLLNMRNDDDWLLIPSRKYSSTLRIKLALDLYNSLGEKDYLCSLPKAEPVDLYINNVYKGLYLLMEKPDKKLFGIDDSKDSDILIKAENWYGHGKTIWNQITPQSKELNKDVIELENFILTSSDKEFFNNESGIFTKINRTQIIDLILFELFIGHDSIEGSKIFIIRKENLNSTFYFAPWDFDMSWGFSRKKNLSYEDWITINAGITSFCKLNHLFYRLLFPKDSSLNQQFRIDLLNRWKELNSTIWKKTFLTNKISALYEYMKKGLLRNNYNEKTENVYKKIERWMLSRFSKLEKIARKHITLNLYSKLPSIYITFQEELTRKSFISCNFELYNSFPHEKHKLLNSSIKLRGRTTWNDAKPSYSLELSKKVSLLGMRDDDDWYLLSMQQDYTRMRIKLAFDLWRSLSASNPTCILPKSRYVNLFLNNEYKGLYLLSERIDKKLFNFLTL
ncbi:MAG: CotH kinase family protein [Promethearchaeota archaeon]